MPYYLEMNCFLFHFLFVCELPEGRYLALLTFGSQAPEQHLAQRACSANVYTAKVSSLMEY